METQGEFAKFCGQCGSPAVDASTLEGGEASCRTCGWKGKSDDLLLHPFQHDFLGKDHMIKAFTADVKGLFNKTVTMEAIKVLLKWGFLNSPDPKVAARYLGNIVRAVVLSVVQTRDTLAKEGT